MNKSDIILFRIAAYYDWSPQPYKNPMAFYFASL